MEHCRVNAFNLVSFQLISLTLCVLYDRINSSLCRWTEDSLPFCCSKGFKAVGALSRGWKIRREASSFFSDKHSKLSYWAPHMLRKNMKCSTAEEVRASLIQSGHRLPRAPQPRERNKKLVPGACTGRLLKGERVSEREPLNKPWQWKHTLSDSPQHPSITDYNKGFTIPLKHKMGPERGPMEMGTDAGGGA